MRLIDADRLLDRCIFYHLPNGDLAVPIIDVQHAPTVEAPDINVGNIDTTTHDSNVVKKGKNDGDGTSGECIRRQAEIEPESISEWKKEFREYVDSLDIARDDWKGIIEYIDELPSAQPERPRGHWVEIGDEPYDEWECDVCGFVIDGSGCIDPEEYRDVYKFCPNCGADMRGEKDEAN